MVKNPSTTVDSVHPEDGANLLSKLMVYWINPLITKSGQSQLASDDVWETPSSQSVEHDAKTVWDAWLKEDDLAASENREPSLTQALYNGFGRDFHFAGGLQAVFMFSQIAQPYLVGELVNFIQIGNGGLSYGAGISVALLVVSLISSMSFTAGFSILRRLGVSIRSGVMMAVYEKSLRLTSASRMQNTIGQTTNLMSIDAEKLFFSAQFLHFVWHGPIANIIVMCLIIQDVGVGPGLLGLASQLALLPIQNILADTIGRVRRRMVSHTDERVKLMNEILQAIRIIKVYAWEVPMEKRIVEVRTKELHCLNLYLVLNAVLRELLFMAGPIASITVFSSLIFYFGQTITLAEMFRVTAFINILRLPTNLFGQALKNLSDGKVSAARLTRFFQLPTLPQTSREIAAKNPQIAVRNANFKWDTVSKGGQKERYERTFFQVILAKILCKSRTTEDTSSNETVELRPEKEVVEEEDTLKGINIISNFPGELIALIGSVGAGKSSLISALLNEIPLVKGSVTVDGRVAYCPQTPWIQNLTLRDNVLFGEDYTDPDIALAYDKVIDAAALKPDIAILTDGDLTEIGERGINLSGGQKARVSIARAILAARTAQIILLDDPFSAVDGATGNWIFEHGILGLLKDRLRIVALNSHRHLLHRFDRVIVLDHGRVVADGRPSDLSPEVLSGVVGADLLPSTQKCGIEAEDDNLIATDPTSLDKAEETIDLIPPSHRQKTLADAIIGRKFSLSDEKATETASRKASIAEESTFDKEKERKLILAEIRKVGDVSSDVYNKYFAAAFEVTSSGSAVFNGTGVDNTANQSLSSLQTFRSVLSISCQVTLFAGAQFVRVAVDYSLARWAQYGGRSSGSKLNDDWSNAYYISFGVLFIFLIARSTALNSLALLSATHIHRDLFRTVVCAPVTTFFDTHTMGEVLNRFSKDTEVIDSSVPEFLMQAFVNWMQVISVFALSLYATPYFAIVIVPLVYLFHRIYLKFGSAQRDLKRLEAVSRSPVYASLSETLSGLDTIRAYSATDRFLRTHLKRMEYNQKFFFHLWMCTSWLTARLEISTSFILFSISILCVCLREEISPVALGLALTYGLQLNALFQRVVQVTIDIMSYMISTERVLEYCEIPPEPTTVPTFQDTHSSIEILKEQSDSVETSSPSAGAGDTTLHPEFRSQLFTLGGLTASRPRQGPILDLPPNWPSQGIVRFDNVWMQYRDNPAVLRGISFTTLPAMRIGICGRTGAGKSSLMVALLRIAPLMKGAVYLDGVDIATVPLQKLRSVIAIIPQDPVLFTGTIRFQLDPFNLYAEGKVWDVLQQVNMSDYVRSTPEGLDAMVFEGGENLSQGQRQLLCIARALLRDARVLIMDEGTSAVDPQTDELIQKVLRVEAAKQGTTVLTIAHRLETIIDFDRILVLGEGSVLEFDTPSNLLADKNSVFSSMISEQGVAHS